MIAALATIIFLATILTVLGIAVKTLEERRMKMVAALRGHSPLAYAARTKPVAVRVSLRGRSQRPLRARARLRAAA